MQSRLFNAAILAGGRSSRMGCDKSELRLNDQTLLERAKQLLLSLGAEEVFVMRQGEVHDMYPDSGPLGGIHGAIYHAPNKPLLIIPVDLPLLCQEDLRALINAGMTGHDITHFPGQYLPVFLANPAQLMPLLTQRLDTRGALSLRHFFEALTCQSVEPVSEHALMNANSPQDWKAIVEQFTQGQSTT
ncbi:MAG TPA: molybdenum cofactor guanylyltransferase [Pseudomonadales bacterium]|nr:molybdenum cofactor guanylyltransferase [Pseudomonadales bacterium]